MFCFFVAEIPTECFVVILFTDISEPIVVLHRWHVDARVTKTSGPSDATDASCH